MKKFEKAILFQNAGIGDFLMALFLAQALKERGVTDRIDIVVHKGAAFLRGFMGEYPYVTLLEISLRRPATWPLLLKLFGARSLVVLPPTIGKFLLKTKLLAWLLAKPGGALIGFQDTGPFCTALYSRTIPYDIRKCFDESIRDILRSLGEEVAEAPRLRIRPSEKILERLGLSGKKYVFFHPRGASDRRRLSGEEAKTVIDFILSTRPDRTVVVSGAEHERGAVEAMARSAPLPGRVVTAIGTTPAELAALIEGAELFVGMDTGITHLACFLGARSLVIGKNATANWLPYYNPNATIIFRFTEDEKSSTSEAYMRECQKGRLRPFKDVPVGEICAELGRMLGVPR